ncbi:hypothetical protein FKW77_002896 [Venturia effusa]|uniref:Cylicin I n=1 Tax=Venturia effusa TaxID=50376 RepID=A0A517LNJ5_9PEZI|nr:hypothetical protein FKW77_002896 [Venturia effusa]
MLIGRATALRASSVNAFARSARNAPSKSSQQCFRLAQQTGRRQYSSAKDHTVKKASSDIPWLVSAIAMTIGGTYAALQPRDPVHHDDHGEGHGEGHDGEHEEKEESSEEESSQESKDEGESAEGGDEQKDSADDANKEEATESKGEGEKEDSDQSEDKSKKSGDDEVSNKGMTKSASNTVKHEETGTGKKLRLDSSAGKTIGEGSSSGGEDDMSHKQRGMSNTDTKHSTDPSKDPEKSKKGEGTVETAKIKGTVDPSRPQV